MTLGREIELVQRHRAEADLAVAAASILARDEFVKRLAALEKEFEMKLPKGASAAVDAAAKEFMEKHGVESWQRWPKCTSARLCGCKGCPNRRKRNGGGPDRSAKDPTGKSPCRHNEAGGRGRKLSPHP